MTKPIYVLPQITAAALKGLGMKRAHVQVFSEYGSARVDRRAASS